MYKHVHVCFYSLGRVTTEYSVEVESWGSSPSSLDSRNRLWTGSEVPSEPSSSPSTCPNHARILYKHILIIKHNIGCGEGCVLPFWGQCRIMFPSVSWVNVTELTDSRVTVAGTSPVFMLSLQVNLTDTQTDSLIMCWRQVYTLYLYCTRYSLY